MYLHMCIRTCMCMCMCIVNRCICIYTQMAYAHTHIYIYVSYIVMQNIHIKINILEGYEDLKVKA